MTHDGTAEAIAEAAGTAIAPCLEDDGGQPLHQQIPDLLLCGDLRIVADIRFLLIALSGHEEGFQQRAQVVKGLSAVILLGALLAGIAWACVGMDGIQNNLIGIQTEAVVLQLFPHREDEVPRGLRQVAAAEDDLILAVFNDERRSRQRLFHIFGDTFGKLAVEGDLLIGRDARFRPADLQIAHVTQTPFLLKNL